MCQFQVLLIFYLFVIRRIWSVQRGPECTPLLGVVIYFVCLSQDEYGQFNVDQNAHMYWVSFLDGMQRVLLFTSDADIATGAEAAGELEEFDQEIVVAIHGLGLSLVDNIVRQEVLYLGITR